MPAVRLVHGSLLVCLLSSCRAPVETFCGSLERADRAIAAAWQRRAADPDAVADAARSASGDLSAAAEDIPYGRDGGPEARDVSFVVSRIAVADEVTVIEELFRVYGALLDSYSRRHCGLGGGDPP
jgi:hypothetical protein